MSGGAKRDVPKCKYKKARDVAKRASPGRSRDENTVLNGEGIGRQALYVPVADGADVYQKGNDVQTLSDRNLADLLK